eukprot:gene14864-5988_t
MDQMQSSNLESLRRVKKKRIGREAAIDKSQENVLFLDNLSCQTSEEFIFSCRRKANTVVYPLPPSFTDKVQPQPVDDGEGRQMKKLIVEQLDKYLEDDANIKTWCGESLSASKKRIIIIKWVGATWEEMTADGFGDKLISPQGYKD